LSEILTEYSTLNVLICVEVGESVTEYIKAQNKNFPYLTCVRDLDREEFAMFSLFPKFQAVEERQVIIGQTLLDFGNRVKLNQAMSRSPHQPYRLINADELMKAIGLAVLDQAVSAEAVLAITILLDIDAILGEETERPFSELHNFSLNVKQAMHHTHLSSDVRSGPQWGAKDATLLHGVHQSVDEVKMLHKWSTKSPILRAPVSYTIIHVAFVYPANQCLNQSFRGMQLINMELSMEDAGVRLANYHASLLLLSYLYNALNQKELLSVTWPDLDTAIRAHKDSIFFGSFPRTPKDIAMRFSLRLGLPLTAYLDLDPKYLKPLKPNQNMTKAKTGGKNQGGVKSKLDNNCLKMTATSLAMEQYFTGQESLIRVAHGIVTIAQKNHSTGDKYVQIIHFFFLEHLLLTTLS